MLCHLFPPLFRFPEDPVKEFLWFPSSPLSLTKLLCLPRSVKDPLQDALPCPTVKLSLPSPIAGMSRSDGPLGSLFPSTAIAAQQTQSSAKEQLFPRLEKEKKPILPTQESGHLVRPGFGLFEGETRRLAPLQEALSVRAPSLTDAKPGGYV